LPDKGRGEEEVLEALGAFASEDPDYRKGRTWSLVYYLGEEHTHFLQQAYARFFSANGLNPMAFRSLKRLESEVISMTADLMHGDRDVVGTMTSGGTESCLLAVKTYRDMARARKPWILRPEMVIPETAHVAWEKGAKYFDVKPVHAPLDAEHRVDVRAVRRLVGRNTVMILGSAPEYPHGIVDPIEELSGVALKRKVPLHVDACVGGYLLPFVEKLGHQVPPWDFRVPGVTSISADIHKYGYAAKGASAILYRSTDVLEHQMFVHTDWPGGIFASAGMLGTRPGGAVAAAWATMQALGHDGYMQQAEKVMDATRRIIEGVEAIPELEVIGSPHMSLLSYRSRSPDLNIFAVGDQMERKGWHIDRLQKPDALHAMVTPLHAEVVDEYLADLRAGVETVKADPELATKGGAAMYGMISHVPLRGMIRKTVMKMMLDMYGPDVKIPDGEGVDLGDDWAGRIAGRAAEVYLRLVEKVRGLR